MHPRNEQSRVHAAPPAPHEQRAPRKIEMSRLQRRDIRLSSRELDWGPLHLERRESEPGSIEFAAGATEHLVFVSLAHARIRCERGADSVELDIGPGFVAVQPSHTPVRWSWAHAPVLCPARVGPGIPAHRRRAGPGHGCRRGRAGAGRA